MMASLTNVLSTLERVIDSEFEGNFPMNRDIEDIREYLRRCETSREALQWHADEMDSVRKFPCSADLQTMCENVAEPFLLAITKATVLRKWAAGELAPSVSPKELLYMALADILVALKKFEIIATSPEMHVRHFMRVVRSYLKKILSLAVILGSLALPGGWFKEWGYLLRHSELEGFKFDTKDWYLRSQIADPTVRGVLAPLNKTPSLFLPANPTTPLRGDGPYCDQILRKL
jgi:hypothetical protein